VLCYQLFNNCSSETYLADFKTDEIGPGQFSKALVVQLQEIHYPEGAEDVNKPALKSFVQIKQLFALMA
jgi:hypothetical protein